MSVHGMKPTFKDAEGYRAWRQEWRELYAHQTARSRAMKQSVKHFQRVLSKDQAAGDEDGIHGAGRELFTCQREARYNRVMGHKLMTVLNEAKIRWQNIRAMEEGIAAQMAEFPLTVEDCRNIDFHFNKKSIEFPAIPAWVLKAKGKTYYVKNVTATAAWTTRENPDHPSTKGSIRIKRGTIHINEAGEATVG